MAVNVTGKSVACSKSWFVAQTRMHHEKKVGEYLTQMDIENFLPIQTRMHQWSDRCKKIDHILIPMKIFVHIDPTERKKVLGLQSVTRYMVLYGSSTPAVIPDEQMNRFKFMLDYSEEAISMNESTLALGQRVRVIKGALKGLEGELITIDGKTKITVRLGILGHAGVGMPIGFVEPIG